MGATAKTVVNASNVSIIIRRFTRFRTRSYSNNAFCDGVGPTRRILSRVWSNYFSNFGTRYLNYTRDTNGVSFSMNHTQNFCTFMRHSILEDTARRISYPSNLSIRDGSVSFRFNVLNYLAPIQDVVFKNEPVAFATYVMDFSVMGIA